MDTDNISAYFGDRYRLNDSK